MVDPVVPVKFTVEISQNVVAFSKYMNFNVIKKTKIFFQIFAAFSEYINFNSIIQIKWWPPTAAPALTFVEYVAHQHAFLT